MVTGASWVHFKPRKTKIGEKKSLTPFFHRALQFSHQNSESCNQFSKLSRKFEHSLDQILKIWFTDDVD